VNWKSFLTGFGSGLVGGLVAYHYLSKETGPSPEKILEQVKSTFKEQGPISGSWIHMEAEPYEVNNLKYLVYKGGISQSKKGVTKQHEFVADASTGTILAIQPL
jgi:predicted small secreted protein